MHNRAAALLEQKIAYLPFSLPGSHLESFLEVAWHFGAIGFNVTQPHKSAIAGLIGNSGLQSINTLYRGQSGWLGASTDGPGFCRALERIGKSLRSIERVVFLGSGGAVISILEHFFDRASKGEQVPSKIAILRRSNVHDPQLSTIMKSVAKVHLVGLSPKELSDQLAGTGEDTIFVQASSAPIHGDFLTSYASAIDSFRGCVVDLVYGRPSDIYYRALAKDLLVQDGEPMLIEQARLSQEIWWGRSAPYEEMALAIRKKS